jgi:hypothetical protein
MMRTIGKILGILVAAGFLFASGAHESALVNAQRLTDAGAYDAAITETLRYIFFNPDSQTVRLLLTISDLYRATGNYVQARRTLNEAHARAQTDSLQETIKIKIALIAMAEKNYSSAELDLLRISCFSTNPRLKKEANLFLTFVYIYTNRWDKLLAAIPVLTKDSLCQAASLMDSLLRECNYQKRKSPIVARNLSTFVPGLGQVYSHDLKNGVNALAISILTTYMTINSLTTGYYQEAILTDVTLFWRYYNGNRWLAMQAAEKYNEKLDNALREKLISAIERTYAAGAVVPVNGK